MRETKRTVCERGYFHTGNSGVQISMTEHKTIYGSDEGLQPHYEHFLEIRHSAFGAGTTIKSPIGGPAMCEYYIEAFTRLRDRMVNDPDYRLPHPFENYGYDGAKPDRWGHAPKKDGRIVDIANGFKREPVWTEEIVASEYSTSSTHIGYNLIDPATNEIIEFVPLPEELQTSRGSGGSAKSYKNEDVGKAVKDVERIVHESDEVGYIVKGPKR